MLPWVLLALLIAVIVLIVVVVRQQRLAARPVDTREGTTAVVRKDPFADTDSAAGDPRTLKVGDMVEYLDRRFFVRGSLHLREGGFSWQEHFLDDVEGTKRWVSVEEDPDLEVVLWTEIDETGLSPDSPVLTFSGVEYRREEHGTATYDAEGSTGVGNSGRVEYVDFVGPAGTYLSFERFAGGAWEAGVGERVPAGTMTIYPAS